MEQQQHGLARPLRVELILGAEALVQLVEHGAAVARLQVVLQLLHRRLQPGLRVVFAAGGEQQQRAQQQRRPQPTQQRQGEPWLQIHRRTFCR
ncbi:hypothetical protein D9M69_608740 [compost metagenome]